MAAQLEGTLVEGIDEGTRLSLRYMQRLVNEATAAARDTRIHAAV